MALKELEDIARRRLREALSGREVPYDARPNLTLGTSFPDPDTVVFDLYIAGQRPTDAVYLARAILNRSTGEGSVHVFCDALKKAD
jgi:hypothetical protein